MNPTILLIALIAALALAAVMAAWAMTERARARMLAGQHGQTTELLRAQAAESAQAVAKALIERTDESFKAREAVAEQRLKEQLKPVAETLAKFQEQVTAVEKARAEETGGLKEQIAGLMRASVDTQNEARKLSAALRRGAGVQGRWGEQVLRNVLEAAGLTHRFDFEEQVSLDTEEGRRRPDVKVRLPGGAVFVIDAKCSLNAFMEAQDATDDTAREACLARHAQSVRAHMTSLSAKTYWDQFKTERSPDFVAMFVPGDGFLAAALDRLPDLMTEAMEKRVILVTPSTLFALCKAVSYGWRVEDQAENAAHIATLGKELYKRLSVMGEHVGNVGKSLAAAVGHYNKFAGSLESQVLTQARRFEDLKVDHEGREIDALAPIEVAPRTLTKLGGDDEAQDGPPALTSAKA